MRSVAIAATIACVAGCATGSGAGGASSSHGVDVARYGRLLAMADERRADTALIQSMLRSGSSP
jgi:hypothetical protein